MDKLIVVSSTIIVQWIRIHCGFAQPGGSTYEPSDSTLRTLLSHIPTEGDGDTFPPFHVEFSTLEEWQSYHDDCHKIPTSNDITLKYMAQDMDKIANSNVPLSHPVLNRVLAESQSRTQILADSFKAAVSSLPTNPLENLSAEDKAALAIANSPPFQLPPSKLYTDALTPTDYAFITGNTQTRVAIAIALADQEMEGWSMLGSHCTQRFNELETTRQELEKKQEMLRASRAGSLAFYKMAQRTATVVDEIQEEVDAAMSNPLTKTLMDRKLSQSQNTFGSPKILPYPNQGRPSPGVPGLYTPFTSFSNIKEPSRNSIRCFN